MSKLLTRALSPAKLNGLKLRNRILKAATFEGKTPKGCPSKELVEFHRKIGDGGTAMTTIAYCGTEADGRIFENMLYMHEAIRPELEQLIAEVQKTGCAVSGQLAHCGNFTKNRGLKRKRPLGPSFTVNTLGLFDGMPFAGSMNHKDIDQLVSSFSDAAFFMKSTGFDAIEIHFGHGYGLSQFISPISNRRTDQYGGSLVNRMRLPLRVLNAVREAVGDDYPILGKISMEDGVKRGITIDESLEVASMLDKGGIDAIIPSIGTSSMNTSIMFRGDSMAQGMVEQAKNPLMKLGIYLMANRLFKTLPYFDLYLLEYSKRIREKVKCAVVYIGGCSNAKSVETVMREGFDFIQLGRPLIYDPNFVKNMKLNNQYQNGCSHCNRCATLIEASGGISCPEFKDEYRKA